ncbi:hypothetical protein [Burkholderia multivorans]|uniref:hypothetical protein n=1 Tax=Burkholderia multivorans TaxID=87883 RepID=UPI002018FD1F|nr:hypothetical protein [Burkholderia multivorans]MCO1384337.1 hypothetical protein [Burkholderia multivorans]MCO1400022.1 hypothetical protein [Burkholderia multivorans]UQO80927.1 hypothetical protein L0Z12_20975 [Burkholderia multivorans]
MLQLDAVIEVGSDDGPPFALDTHDWQVIHTGTLKNPITDLRKLSEQSPKFYEEISDLITAYRPDGLAACNLINDDRVSAMLGIMSVMPSAMFVTTRGLVFPENNSTYVKPHIDERVEFSPLYLCPVPQENAILIASHALQDGVHKRFGLEIPRIGPREFKSMIRNYYGTTKKGAS